MAVDPLSDVSAGPSADRRRGLWSLALCALWLLAALVIWLLARGVLAPSRFQDEFLFWALGKSLAADGTLAWRDAPVSLPAALYPLLIAPVFRLAGSVSTQHELVKAFNALVVSAIVLPVYLGARQLVRPALALLAALFAVVVPAVNYAGLIGTESISYPLAAAALLALAHALARPGTRSAAGALLLILLTIFARLQFVSLLAVVVLALLFGVLFAAPGSRREHLRERRALIAGTALLLLAGTLWAAVRGFATVGIYRGAVDPTTFAWGDLWYWFSAYLSDVWVLSAIVPTIATFALLGRRRLRAEAALAALLAVTLAAVVVFVLQMTWFGAINTEFWRERNVFYERYMFYLGPLFFIGLVAALGRVSRRSVTISTAVAVVVLLLTPNGILRPPLSLDAFGHAFLASLASSSSFVSGHVGLVLALTALVGGIALTTFARGLDAEDSAVRLGRLLAVVLPLFLLVSAQAKAWSLQRIFSEDWRAISAQPLDWVDRASDQDVALLVGNLAEPTRFYQTEFWNPRISRVYVSREAPVHSFSVYSPTCTLDFAPDGALRSRGGSWCAGVPRAWVVSSPSFAMLLRSAHVFPRPAADPYIQLQVSDGPPRVLAMVSGLPMAGNQNVGTLQLRSFLERPGELRVGVSGDEGRRQLTRRLPAGDHTLELPLAPEGQPAPTVSSVAVREGGGPWRSLWAARPAG